MGFTYDELNPITSEAFSVSNPSSLAVAATATAAAGGS
jgi:hypothetical protein